MSGCGCPDLGCRCRAEQPDHYVDARDADAMNHFEIIFCPIHKVTLEMVEFLKRLATDGSVYESESREAVRLLTKAGVWK